MQIETRISVHALTEFVFCPRAGLLASETSSDDPGHDLGAQRLDYAPNYLIRELQRQFAMHLAFVVLVGVATIGAILFCFRSELDVGPVAGFLIVFATIKLMPPMLGDLCRLAARLVKASIASSREPDLTNSTPERVGWWQLVSAGYEVTMSDSMFDDTIDLGGKPWRLMVKGRRVVPIFLRRTAHTEELRIQHQIRMNAYCHLLRLAGSDSPFGVVLDYGTEQCWIVKPMSATWQLTLSHLAAFRQMIADVRSGTTEPSAPDNLGLCRGCPFGNPVTNEPETSLRTCRGTVVKTNWISAGQNKFRSTCGDRFHWLAPHENAISKNFDTP